MLALWDVGNLSEEKRKEKICPKKVVFTLSLVTAIVCVGVWVCGLIPEIPRWPVVHGRFVRAVRALRPRRDRRVELPEPGGQRALKEPAGPSSSPLRGLSRPLRIRRRARRRRVPSSPRNTLRGRESRPRQFYRGTTGRRGRGIGQSSSLERPASFPRPAPGTRTPPSPPRRAWWHVPRPAPTAGAWSSAACKTTSWTRRPRTRPRFHLTGPLRFGRLGRAPDEGRARRDYARPRPPCSYVPARLPTPCPAPAPRACSLASRPQAPSPSAPPVASRPPVLAPPPSPLRFRPRSCGPALRPPASARPRPTQWRVRRAPRQSLLPSLRSSG